jgi:hypothetical protein
MEATESAEADIPEVPTEVAEEPADHTVKIGGVEEQVTLSELRDGYQRQSDYTRKTQELASERERLQQAEAIVSALESDPTGTLTALGQAFGVDTPNPQSRAPDYGEWQEESDPMQKRLHSLEAQVASQARTHRQQALDKEVSGLKDRYGEFDETALFQHALSNRIPNLEAAYTHMRFGEVAATAEKLQRERDITDDKRKAGSVAGGKSTQSGAVQSTVSSEKVGSLREAFALAKREHST